MFEETDDMEMPCRCDCGMWFDLNDGSRKPGSDKVVCGECGEAYEKIEKIELQIESLEMEIENLDGEKNVKRKIKEFELRIAELRHQILLIEP